MFLCHWENRETVNLIEKVPHKSVLNCATVVSFPIARAERKTCLPRFCLHLLRISQAFCSPLVIGQETTVMQANQHKQNYSTVCFCCLSVIVFQQHFRRPGWKKSTRLIKPAGTTTALSACPHANLNQDNSINVFVCLFKYPCFSFLKANALSIPSVLFSQLLLSFQRCWSY